MAQSVSRKLGIWSDPEIGLFLRIFIADNTSSTLNEVKWRLGIHSEKASTISCQPVKRSPFLYITPGVLLVPLRVPIKDQKFLTSRHIDISILEI
ncbi:hypothetical protein Trydic_g10014 [Trypoxylus dichotomus]